MGRYQSSETAHCGDQRIVVCAAAFHLRLARFDEPKSFLHISPYAVGAASLTRNRSSALRTSKRFRERRSRLPRYDDVPRPKVSLPDFRADDLSGNNNLDPPVLLPTGRGCVIGDGRCLAEALGTDRIRR
jgi:hypothetical protein